jgi:hypothetical protein
VHRYLAPEVESLVDREYVALTTMTTSRSHMRRLGACAAVILGVLTAAPLALAQQPTSGAGEGGGVQGAVGGGSSGALPFTGLDILFVVLAGLALLAVGFGLRVASRGRSS